MNLVKLSSMLCLALSESDGPFSVEIKYKNPQQYGRRKISRDELEKLSFDESVDFIKIINSISDRRWRKRFYIDRRKFTRNNE